MTRGTGSEMTIPIKVFVFGTSFVALFRLPKISFRTCVYLGQFPYHWHLFWCLLKFPVDPTKSLLFLSPFPPMFSFFHPSSSQLTLPLAEILSTRQDKVIKVSIPCKESCENKMCLSLNSSLAPRQSQKRPKWTQ